VLRQRRSSFLPVAALTALLAACADTPATLPPASRAPRASVAAGTLQWFGYAASTQDEPTLAGTDSYANWGEVITDSSSTSTAATAQINALSQHGMKAVVELGELLWAAPSHTTLYPDYTARWNAWKAANASALTSGKVLAFLVLDEPFSKGADMSQYEAAAAMVKRDFPWAKVILIEAAVTVNCTGPACAFGTRAGLVTSVDWVGVDRYAIDPRTDTPLHDAVQRMKQQYPGRKMVYVMDSYWDQTHVDSLGVTTPGDMQPVATWWYDVARADPDAVMIATFIWGRIDNTTTAVDFPPAVLEEHTRIGREITGRSAGSSYAATGSFTVGTDGYAAGWACDPDAAWGESMVVRIFQDGAPYSQGTANLADVAQRGVCRNGSYYHAFRIPLSVGTMGHAMTATVQDLNGTQYPLATTCKDAPACVWYYNSYTAQGSAALSSTGLLTGWACDRDVPALAIQVQVNAGGTIIGSYAANAPSDASVNATCGGGTAHAFSIQLPAWTHGQIIYANAMDSMSGSTWIGPFSPRNW
jgi:hypothetical protein